MSTESFRSSAIVRARRRLRWVIGGCIAAASVGVAWGIALDAPVVPTVLGVAVLGVGVPVVIMLWFDLVRTPRPAGDEPRGLGHRLGVLSIRGFGLVTLSVGLVLSAWCATHLLDADLDRPTQGSPWVSLLVGLSLIAVGTRWTRRPLTRDGTTRSSTAVPAMHVVFWAPRGIVHFIAIAVMGTVLTVVVAVVAAGWSSVGEEERSEATAERAARLLAPTHFTSDYTEIGPGVTRIRTQGLGGPGLVWMTTLQAGWPYRCLEAVTHETDAWNEGFSFDSRPPAPSSMEGGLVVPRFFPQRDAFEPTQLERIPIRPRPAALIGNAVVWSLAVFVAWVAAGSIRATWRLSAGRCVLCGHPVLTRPRRLCPECGAEVLDGLSARPT